MACEESNRCRNCCHRSGPGHGSAAGCDANASTDLSSNTSTSPSKSGLFAAFFNTLGLSETALAVPETTVAA